MSLPVELIDQIILFTENFELSAQLGNKWVCKKLYNPDIHNWISACKTGNLTIVTWLHINEKEGCTSKCLDDAAYNGHFDVVKFLHRYRKEGCTIRAMDLAAYNGHFEIVKYLDKNRSEGCHSNTHRECEKGHCLIAEWLYKNRNEGFSSHTDYFKSKNKDIDIVELLSKIKLKN